MACALARTMDSGLPAVLDCHTRVEPHPARPAFGGMNRYGFDALVGTSVLPSHRALSGRRFGR